MILGAGSSDGVTLCSKPGHTAATEHIDYQVAGLGKKLNQEFRH
ncbi:hypothetical protein AAAC12_36455 [Pseudomonas aeruginosa]